MSIASKIFGGLAPTVTFQGQPAAVEAINFGVGDGSIIVRLQDKRRVEVKLTIAGMALVPDEAAP